MSKVKIVGFINIDKIEQGSSVSKGARRFLKNTRKEIEDTRRHERIRAYYKKAWGGL